MATATGVTIHNLNETLRDLERFGGDAGDLREAFGGIGEQIVADARGAINDASGELGSSITAARTANKITVRAAAPHAGVINYGWPAHGIEAQEFLTGPANDDLEAKVELIDANLQQLIRKYQLS